MSSVFAKLSAVFLSPVLAIGTAYGAHQSLQDALPDDFKAAQMSTSSASAAFSGANLLSEIECDIDCMNDFAELAGVIVDYYREKKYKTSGETQDEHAQAEGSKKGTGVAGAKPLSGKGDRNPLDVDLLFDGPVLLSRPAFTTPISIERHGMPIAILPGVPPNPSEFIYS